LQCGAVSEAQRWLAHAAWLGSHAGETQLTRATGFRLLKQMDCWRAAVESAMQEGAPPTLIQREVKLGSLSFGEFDPQAGAKMGQWTSEAATSYDVPIAFLESCLANGNHPVARRLLEAWSADAPADVHVEYAWGTYLRRLGRWQEAQRHFEAALGREPRHELARLALAGLLEAQLQPDAALAHYLALRRSAPASELAAVGVARMLRHRLRFDEARLTLEPFARRDRVSAAVRTELGQVALESGDCAQALRWLERVPEDPATRHDAVSAAALARSLTGQIVDADRLFAYVRAESHRQTRRYDLEVRLAIDPHDDPARRELEQISRSLPAAGLSAADSADPLLPGPAGAPASPALRLYAQSCSACHGSDGDGAGPAARHLYPRPTNFRSGKFRLTSVANRVASRDDILAVLRRGIPGTSMRAFDKLANDEQETLADEVLRLRDAGFRDRIALGMPGTPHPAMAVSDQRQLIDLVHFCRSLAEGPPRVLTNHQRALQSTGRAYLSPLGRTRTDAPPPGP